MDIQSEWRVDSQEALVCIQRFIQSHDLKGPRRVIAWDIGRISLCQRQADPAVQMEVHQQAEYLGMAGALQFIVHA